MSRPSSPADAQRPEADRSPLLGSWRNLYLLVVVELVLTVALLHALTRWAS